MLPRLGREEGGMRKQKQRMTKEKGRQNDEETDEEGNEAGRGEGGREGTGSNHTIEQGALSDEPDPVPVCFVQLAGK